MEKKTKGSMRIRTVPILLLIFFTGCSKSQDKKSEKKTITLKSGESIKNFTFIETEGKKKKWVMVADSADFIETSKGEIIEVRDFNVKFFEDNKAQTVLKAKMGNYNRNTKELVTRGDVEIETESRKIVTKNVVWDPTRELFITDEDVLIETSDGIIKGKGMESSRDLENIKIKNEIKSELKE